MSKDIVILNEDTNIALIIKKLRKQRKITQSELADYAGLELQKSKQEKVILNFPH